MKKSLLPSILLSIVVLVGFIPACFAGSDRWIMVMTADRMIQEKLIHVRFFRPDGTALESDFLKAMSIHEQNCGSGPLLKMADDYRMGFAPVTRMLGVYLFPSAWQEKDLCFSVPDIGKAERRFAATDNNGLTIRIDMAP